MTTESHPAESKPEQRPLPWVIESDAIFSGNDCVADCGANTLTYAQRKANARLIVAAVNEREGLRQLMLELVNAMEWPTPDRNRRAIAQRVRAALAKSG